MTESGKCSADAGPPWQPLLGVLLHTGQKTEDGKVCRTSCMYAFSHWSPTYICKCCHRNARDSFLPAKSILGIMGPENSFVRQTANRQLLINHTLNFCHLTGGGGDLILLMHPTPQWKNLIPYWFLFRFGNLEILTLSLVLFNFNYIVLTI